MGVLDRVAILEGLGRLVVSRGLLGSGLLVGLELLCLAYSVAPSGGHGFIGGEPVGHDVVCLAISSGSGP